MDKGERTRTGRKGKVGQGRKDLGTREERDKNKASTPTTGNMTTRKIINKCNSKTPIRMEVKKKQLRSILQAT